MRPITWLTALCALSAPICTQSFNVNLSDGASPSSSYGAAGAAGHWNTIAGVTAVEYPLTTRGGNTSNVTVRNLGGTSIEVRDNAATSGDEAALLDTFLATFNQIETCLRFSNLQNGRYQVITYAWHGTNPGVDARVTCDESVDPAQIVGGSWPGTPQLEVVYAVHIATVVNHTLNVHSGLHGSSIAAMNGVQLRRLTPADGYVGLGEGGPFSVLKVDGSEGGFARRVNVALGSEFSIDIEQPPTATGPAHYVLFGCLGTPNSNDRTVLLDGMGTLRFPPASLAPTDTRLFTMGASFFPGLWSPAFFTSAAPTSLSIPAGLPPLQFTLQAILEQRSGEFRVSNSVICDIQ